MTENPYVSPQADTTVPAAKRAKPLYELAPPIFRAWEKLRLLYIGILAVPVLMPLANVPPTSGYFQYWLVVFVGAVIANVCYFAGPIAETYGSWLGFPSKVLRISLFVLGTIFAGFLTVVVVATQFLMTFD